MDLEYRILGPLEVRRDGEPIDLGGAKQRTLLATLLLRANQSVSTDQIIDELWGATPPKGARDTVHAYVRRLHRTLRGPQDPRSPYSRSSPDAKLLHGDAFGYRLTVGQDQLDLHRFDSLAARAKRALLAGEAVEARTLLDDALSLWRGRPLVDVASESHRAAAAARLTENRLAAVEDRIEADLALQRHAELIGELDELVQTYPTRERFCEQLMLALYRAGRQVDALDTYRRTRHLLAEEYGCDPSIGLQQLEHAILTNDPALGPRPMRDAPEAPVRRVPCQLPPDINDFTGRADVLDRLAKWFTSGAITAPILAVAGQAGVGKSTLAVHLARRVSRTHYPDGQLYANFRGCNRKEPFDVLAQFLRGLGVDDAIMPGTLDEREQLFRTLLTGRRVLIVLDNAPDESAVRPLLPGDPGCGAILTSRRRLGGLESARCEHLPVFTEEESLHLLESLVGAERLALEQPAARAIAERCGHLPLALRIAGARLAAKPHWQSSRLAAKLDHPQQRLDELAIGDLNVRSSIRLSYDELTTIERAALSELAALPLPDFPSWVAADLLDIPQPDAEDLLERLADEQLLDVVARDAFGQIRYRIPGLTRDLALEHGKDALPGRARVFSRYLSLATCAAHALRPGSRSGEQSAGCGDLAHDIAEQVRTCPISWFISENHCLFSVIRHLHDTTPRLCWRLAVTLFEFLRLHNRWNAVEETYQLALSAARACDEPDGEAHVLHALGVAQAAQDRPHEAVEHYTAALSLRRGRSDHHHEARLLLDLGHADLAQGQWDTAERRFREVLPTMREVGDSSGESEALAGLARAHRFRGLLGEAIHHLHSSLVIDGAHHGQAHRLLDLAMTVRDLSLLQPEAEALRCSAVRCFRQAARQFRHFGDKRNEMYALTGVATCRTEQGRPREAQALGEHALAVFQRIGYPRGEALAHRVVGMAHLSEGNAEAAIDSLTHSLRTDSVAEKPPGVVATESWDQVSRLVDRTPQVMLRQHGRSLYHLGVAFRKLGRSADAAWYCRRSAEIAKLLGPPQWTIPPLRVLVELDAEPDGGNVNEELQQIRSSIELPTGWRDTDELAGSAPRPPPEFAAIFP